MIDKPSKSKANKSHPHLLHSVAGRSDLWINQIAKNKNENINEEDDDYKFNENEIQLEDAKYKKYDENGFLITGYDYTQHLVVNFFMNQV